MATPRRRLLGMIRVMGGRQFVYEAADALEIDEPEENEIRRRKVYYDEILLVTYHRRVGWGYVLGCAAIAAIALAIAASSVAAGAVATIAFGISAILWLPALGAALLRIAVGTHIVGAYGKRTRARMEFAFRPGKAREAYERVAALAREHQAVRWR